MSLNLEYQAFQIIILFIIKQLISRILKIIIKMNLNKLN